MTQTIDSARLKAAAEQLEWVLKQYHDSDEVQSLLHALTPLIEKAKAQGDGCRRPPARSASLPAPDWNRPRPRVNEVSRTSPCKPTKPPAR